MKSVFLVLSVLLLATPLQYCKGQSDEESKEGYSYKKEDPTGIGKWYMGREIAHVMGFQGKSWLERPEREAEERTSTLLKNMDIKTTDTIADIGAGSGYHVFKMAAMANEGHIYAVDIQDEMLTAIQQKKEETGITHIAAIKGGNKSVNLRDNSVDKILMVDVYHEFDFPKEMIAAMKRALRSDGKIYLVEYRGEDSNVPIKKLHKMTENQAVKEFKAAGFTLERNMDNLPWQHCMVFIKA
jgi:precorrin-6B methylase 2